MVSDIIFNLIYNKEYKKLREFIHSTQCNVNDVDEMNRSPIFVCFVENNYEALLILLENGGFRSLFNQPVKQIEQYAGMYEFQHGFMSFHDPRELISLFPFIDNINQVDDQGIHCLHYFVWGFEGYCLCRHRDHYTPESQAKLKLILNSEVKEFFLACSQTKMDFNLKNKLGQTAFESIDVAYQEYFQNSLDFILFQIEKNTLENNLTKNMIEESKKIKL